MNWEAYTLTARERVGSSPNPDKILGLKHEI